MLGVQPLLVFLHLILMVVPCCQDFRSRQEALRNAAAVGGGFMWPPHPSPGDISMPGIYPLSRPFSLRSVDAAFEIAGWQNRGFVLLKKNTKQRATSAFTIM